MSDQLPGPGEMSRHKMMEFSIADKKNLGKVCPYYQHVDL